MGEAWGDAQVQPPTARPLKHFGPMKGVGGWELGVLGGGGGGGAGIPVTPTYILQNNPLVVLIILNTHMLGL